MSFRRNRLLMALALALPCASLVRAAGTPSTQAQMEQLIRFLSQRIQEEDPAASPEAIRGALYESLEMMGVSVPASVRERGDMSSAELASTLLGSAPAGSAPALGPTGTRRPSDDVFMVEDEGPAAVASAASPAPRPVSAMPPPAVRPESAPISADQLDQLVAAFPQISTFVPPRKAPDSPAVAEMARVLLAQPAQNPWKPALKPVGAAQPMRSTAPAPLPQVSPVPSAPQEPAGAGGMPAPGTDGSSQVAELLRQMRSKRRGTQLTPDMDIGPGTRQDG